MRKRTRRYLSDSRADERLKLTYMLALVAGLVMVYSTSSILAESRFGSQFYFLWHQFLWACLSVAAIVIIGKIDLERVSVYSPLAFLTTLVMLGLVFLMPERNGAHRWLELGPVTIQPSEPFKFVLVFIRR